MCVVWFWQQFRQGDWSETSVFFVLESSAKDVCFVDGNMKQNIQPIAVHENAWMWININYLVMNSVFWAINCEESFINLNLTDIVLFIRNSIEATRAVNRHYCFHLLSVLILKGMYRRWLYVWIACYTPARRSTSAFCLNLPLGNIQRSIIKFCRAR